MFKSLFCLKGCIKRLERFIRAESMVFIVMGCGFAGVVVSINSKLL